MEFNRAVEPADACQRLAPDREVAAVEDRAEVQRTVQKKMRRRRNRHVVGANERTAPPVPVVEPVRAGHADQTLVRREALLNALEPPDRRAAVGVHEREDVAAGLAAARSRATTSPFLGSSMTPPPGTARARAAVSSVLALLITMISSGGRVCASKEKRQAGRSCASLYAHTIAVIVTANVVRRPFTAGYWVDVTILPPPAHIDVNGD